MPRHSSIQLLSQLSTTSSDKQLKVCNRKKFSESDRLEYFVSNNPIVLCSYHNLSKR